MPLSSMTGFAEIRGSSGPWTWVWDIRSVNGRGFDLRLRLPEGFGALEETIRAEARRVIARGNVTVGLRIGEEAGSPPARLSPAGLAAAVAMMRGAEEAAMAAGLDLGPASAADLLALRGVVETSAPAGDEKLMARLAADVAPLFAALVLSRRREGAALGHLLSAQAGRIADLVGAARATLEARAAGTAEGLRARLTLLLGATPLDEARLAQELALLAVRGDVSEELDRLDVHVGAARALLETDMPGRKLDFLMQEFNREANTLCAKSASAELTAIGLDLKVVIDQAREQVQNLE
jgi:uncharacterized protein (TIGR00255 family)